MRLLAFNQRHLRGPKASTPFNAAMMAAGMLALHANIHVHYRAPKNHLAMTFSFIAGSLGYAVLSPVVNDFVGDYAISARRSNLKSGSSAGLANLPRPSKAVWLSDVSSGNGGVDPSFAVATYASSTNTGRSALFEGSGASQDLLSTGVQGDSTTRNSRNNDEGPSRDRPTPPDEDPPRRSSRLANGKKHSTEKPPVSTKQNSVGGAPPPPPPPSGAGTMPGIEDGSKGYNVHASTFSLGSLLLAGLVLSVLIRAIDSRKGKNLKKKKRLMVCEHILGSNPMCAPLDISNTTSTALDIVDPRLSKPTCEIIHAICGLVTKAYHSNIKLASWRLPSQLGDAVRALVSATAHSVQALNYRLPATGMHFSGDSMITETCKGAYCGGLTLNMSMQHAMESVGRAGSAVYDGVLRQTSRYLRRVLLYVSVVILTMFARQLLCIILPYIEDGVSYVEQPVADIPRPRLLIESAPQVATPIRHTPHNIRKKILLPGSGWVTVEARNHSPSDHQNVPSVDSAEIKVDVIPESQSAIEVLEQIIPEATAVAEPENAVKLDNPIAPVLTEPPLEENAEMFISPSFAVEPSQLDNSENFIHPSFVADINLQHEQVDDSNNFVFQGESNANDNDKDESALVVYPGIVDDSIESVFNDLFGEVKDVNADPDPYIYYVPERDLRTSIYAPQNFNSSDRVGDPGQSSVADKGKPYIAYVPERDLGTSIHAPQNLTSSDRAGDTGKKKANLDVEVEDQKEDIVAVQENATVIDSKLPVFVALPGYRQHRIRPKQRRRAWLASQTAATAAETVA